MNLRRAARSRALMASTIFAATAAAVSITPAHAADPIADLTVKASGGALSDGPIAARSGAPDTNVTFAMQIKNTSTQAQTLRIRVTDGSAFKSMTVKKGYLPWSFDPDPACGGLCVTLGAGRIQAFSVVFKLPNNADLASNHNAGRGAESVYADVMNNGIATETDTLGLLWNVSKAGVGDNHDLSVKSGSQKPVGGAFGNLTPEHQAMGAPTIKPGGAAGYTVTVADTLSADTDMSFCLRIVGVDGDPLDVDQYSYAVTYKVGLKTYNVTNEVIDSGMTCTYVPTAKQAKRAYSIKIIAKPNATTANHAVVEVTLDHAFVPHDWNRSVYLITNLAKVA